MRQNKTQNFLILFAILLLFATCKKETVLTSNTVSFGTVIGDGNPHTITEVIQTEDDQYFICGTVKRGKFGMCDGYVMKVDQQFNVVWYKNYGGSNQDFFESMDMDASGNILLAGNSFSFGASLDASNPNRNNLIYMVYSDKSGNKIWEKTHRANEAGGILNYTNAALKVLTLKNNNFLVGGLTASYSKNNTTNGYVFEITNLGGIKWEGNYFQQPLIAPTSDDFESIDDMDFCEDGNIMLAYQSPKLIGADNFCTLIKIPETSFGYNENRSIWRFRPIDSLASRIFGSFKLQMEMLPGDRVALGQIGQYQIEPANQLTIVNAGGQIISKTKFKHFINNLNLRRTGDKLLVSGFYVNKNIEKFPCWVITDLNGKIQSEFFPTKEMFNPNKFEFITSVINHKNEVVTFAIFSENSISHINIIRFNQTGEVLH